MLPLVSVIIPTYNRVNFVSNAINSIISQSYKNWECIVVDDLSTDNTAEVVNSISMVDDRVKYILNNRKKGAQGARNTGVLKSRGEWICFLDSDDTYYNNKLELQVDLINKNPQVDIVTCFSRVINSKLDDKISFFEYETRGNILKELLTSKVYVDTNCTLIKKSKIIEIDLLDENCPSFQEWDTHIRLAKTCQYDFVPQYLCIYNIHNSDRISNSIEREFIGIIYLLKKHRKVWLDVVGKDEFQKIIIKQIFRILQLKSLALKSKLIYKILSVTPFSVLVFMAKKIIKKIIYA